MAKYVLESKNIWSKYVETKEYDNLEDARYDLYESYSNAIYNDNNMSGYYKGYLRSDVAENEMSAWAEFEYGIGKTYSWEIKIVD